MQKYDTQEDREGFWMHCDSGRRFFPEDPRPEDIHINDIANGLALDCRYAGQGRIDRFYSVAEHCVLMADKMFEDTFNYYLSLATLMHDAAEAYLNDLPLAAKRAVGDGYSKVEESVEKVIFDKYCVSNIMEKEYALIKEYDRRMVPTEKAAIMAIKKPWAMDGMDPLPVRIKCWKPKKAKKKFIQAFYKYGGSEKSWV